MNQTLSNRIVDKTSLRWHAWLLGSLFLLYGLASAFDYVMSLVQGEVYYRACGMTDTQVAYFSNIPVWVTLGWTLSVWGGLSGICALMLRHRSSFLLFSASLIGSAIYMVYTFVLSAGKEAMGGLWFMPFAISGFTLLMIFYARRLFTKPS